MAKSVATRVTDIVTKHCAWNRKFNDIQQSCRRLKFTTGQRNETSAVRAVEEALKDAGIQFRSVNAELCNSSYGGGYWALIVRLPVEQA